MRTLALCSGYGGLELGLELAGFGPELVAYAEIDPHAAKVMARHWPGVPNLGDIETITDPPEVDTITAGFPCQDISTAGKRAGLEGARSGLWWRIAEIVGDIRPRRVMLENVAAITSLGGPAVIGTLAGMGYSIRWGTLRASDAGACHRRARWFCVAENPDIEPRSERRLPAPGQTEGGRARPDAGRRNRTLAAHAEHVDWPRPTGPARRHELADRGGDSLRLLPTPTAGDAKASGARAYPATATRNIGTTLTDATTRGLVDWGDYEPAIRRQEAEFGRCAPDPKVDGRLSPRFVEWMMGLPAGWVTDTPGISRTQALRILGNGVVPQQAAAAYRQLLQENSA